MQCADLFRGMVPGFGLARPDRRGWAGMVLTGGLAALAAALFLPHQSIWIDETTQLTGLSLGPVEALRWLTGSELGDSGVPSDRMPPLSYWVGWLWTQAFGLGESPMRWLGVGCAAGATMLVFSAAAFAFGRPVGWLAGSLMALSPNVATTAVEIRAYPLFLLTSAGAIRSMLLITSLESPGGVQLWISLAAWLIAGLYTHFFGVVFAGAVLTGLLTHAVIVHRPLWPVILLGAAVVVSALGLAPFVMASVNASEGGHAGLTDAIHMLYRLLAHAAMTAVPGIRALALAAAPVAVVAALPLPRERRAPWLALAVVLVAGLSVSIIASFLFSGFTATKSVYAIWALPTLFVLLAASATAQAPRRRLIGISAALVLLMCEAIAIAILWRRGDYFAHGPQRRIQQIIDTLGRSTAVVHAEPVSDYGFVYVPLRYVNGPQLPQFVESSDKARPGVLGSSGSGWAPASKWLDPTDSRWREQLAGYSHLVVVQSRTERADEIANQLRHGDRPLGYSRLLAAIDGSGQWTRRGHQVFVAFVASEVTVFDRVERR